MFFLFLFYNYSAGGLVTAVCPVVIKGQGLWVGWSGLHLQDPNEPIPESNPTDQTPTAGLKSDQVSILPTFWKSQRLIFSFQGCFCKH